jgi:hypothetical protein
MHTVGGRGFESAATIFHRCAGGQGFDQCTDLLSFRLHACSDGAKGSWGLQEGTSQRISSGSSSSAGVTQMTNMHVVVCPAGRLCVACSSTTLSLLLLTAQRKLAKTTGT